VKRGFYLSVAFRALLSAGFILSAESVTHAACDPPGSPSADLIVCSGTDTNGVASDGGNDSVTVTPGALITLDAFGIRNPQATGVDAGDDQDNVLNLGAIIAQATAVLTPILTPPDPIPGLPLFWGALIQVGPQSTGIAGGAGNDTITNAGSVSSTASATTLPAIVPAPVEGVSKADVSSTANAKSTAIDGGDGNDSITNTGSLTADATASATGVSVSLASIKENGKDGKSQLNGNVKANASVTGLAGGAGDDMVTNLGAFDVTSSATTVAAGGAGVEAKGSAAASAKSTAGADAVAIDLGGGNDKLANHAAITATAGSTAFSLDLAVGVKNDPTTKGKIQAAASGGATARSSAIGISADGRATALEFDPKFLTDDTSTTVSLSVTPGALATGDDTVTNDAEVRADATATTLAAGAGVAINGKASAKVKSEAGAEAAAIDLGGGNDTLTNTGTGTLTATAWSTAASLDIAVGDKTDPATKGKIKSAAEGGATANSTAVGISADGLGTDTEYTLELTSKDTSTDTTESSSHTVSFSQKTAHASGDDTVTNDAEVGATSTAVTLAAGVGVTINGSASAKVNSEAEAEAAAIDLGGGNDTLTNTGKLTVSAVSDASALNVAVGETSDASSSRKNGSNSQSAAAGGASASSTAVGISADGLTGDTERGGNLVIDDQGPLFGYSLLLAYDKSETHASGDDVVTNHGDIEVNANATARAAGVGVTVNGAASASSKSSTESVATAIDLGRGSDMLTNTGKLTATADSSSQALNVAVSTKGRATSSDGLWHGGVKSDASATGIDAAGARDSSTADKVSVDDTGIHASFETTKGDITADLHHQITNPDGTANADTTVDGNDQIVNYGDIEAYATATSNAANVSVTSEGTAAAISHAEAKAVSAGIRAGSGDDDVQNLGTGTTTVTAESHANAGQVAVSGKGVAVTADALWDSGTRAESTAVGIDADGGTTDSDLYTVGIDGSGVEIVHETDTTSASGNDTVLNEQAINATATTTVPSIGVALEAKTGLAASVSSVDAQAASTAIRGGDGDDDITNRGKLTATAGATAGAANVAIAKDGVAAASDSVWDGGTTATAAAVGIDADGGDLSKTDNTTLTVDANGPAIQHTTTTQGASGDDTVLNEGDIDANATALSGSASVGIVTKGVSVALSQSTAKSDATAIHGGDGDDTLTNHGKLTANATATATAVSVAVTVDKGGALAGNAVWDGGVTAEATAKGIDADGGDKTLTSVTTIKIGGDTGIDRNTSSEAASGNDVITNTGEIDATANANSPEISAAIAITGVSGAVSTSTATSNATAIDAGAGDDQVNNTGKLTATATSLAVAVNGSVATKGVAISADGVWNGGTKANATAKGVDAGDGNDSIDNGGDVEAHATAVAPSVSGSVAVQGVAGAISASTATANAIAIDGGDGNDTIHNSGKLTSTSVANANGVSVAVTTAGVALAGDNSWDGGVTADATAKGIDTGPGNDTVVNEGEIDTHATAVSPDVAISVAMRGVGGAVSTSTATARAVGIDASAASTSGHGGSDTITNKAKITSNADATAVAVNGSVTTAGVAIAADGVWNGGTHADATALGIQTSGQDDTINNDGEIDTSATAVAPSIAGSVAVEGVAGAISAATATSNATAIDGGAGNDTITNTGKLTSTSVANADAVSVAVTTAGVALAGDNSWDGGVTADATARGIDAGTGSDSVLNEGEIDSHATAVSPDVAVSVAVSGAAGAVSTATATAQSTGIDASADYPDGADTITNKAKITSNADATAVAVNGSVTTAGVAISADGIWDGGTHATATATGIHAGVGNDTVANDGEIDAAATSVAPSISGSLAVSGVAGAISAATATSNATAIDANDGNDAVNNIAKLTASTVANADGVSVAVTTAGAAVAGNTAWDGGVTAAATSKGIDGGKGQDGITNSGEIDTDATAVSTGANVSVAVAGLGGAISAAKAQAQATGIDGGEGDDTIDNTGKITSTTLANADSLGVAVSVYGAGVAGNNTWDGGTSADARSTGIYGGLGQDVIGNGGEIAAKATSVSPQASVGFSVFGVSGAVSTATATSHAAAIDAGDDSDQVDNTAKLTSNADATAVSVNVGLTFGGVGAAGDSVWDGGTTAEATAKGIDSGAGADHVTNDALIETTANSTTVSNSDTITVFGVAGATSTSNSTANATAIDGGDDADVLTNSGELKATSDASATGVNVAVTAIGASVATDSFWDSGTQANATSKGIGGGAGDDLITNSGPITADATSETHSVSVSATGAIVAAASASSTSKAEADAIDGGDGNDAITNDSALVSKATSSAGGVSVSAALAGGALSGSPFDNATQAEATANGIEGGAGDDTVHNTETSAITLDSHAIAKDTAVSVGVIGFSGTNSGSKATARATGIDGGDGNDLLDNRGAITGTVTAEGKARGISVTAAGASIGDASTTADAGATGIAGGAGDDSITNAGAITLTPHAEATGQSVSVGVAGVAIGDAGANATSSATGIGGGPGNNSIDNRGAITETVTASGTARSVNVTAAGFSLGKTDTTVTTDAAGIRGGDDSDNVSNENTIDVGAASTATATSVTVVVGGASNASARTLPEATAVGIDGGGGDDMISNAGDITANATADSVATSSSWTVAGASHSDSGTITTAEANGIAGGDGDDFIENLANVGVHSGTTVSVSGGGFTFAGTGKSTAQLTATTNASGISGGDGNDAIRNTRAVTVDAGSALTSTGGKIVPAGQSDVGATIGATTAATGIDGGAGDDAITNLDAVDVTAGSTVTQNSSTFTFGGVGATHGTLAATSTATGIIGGDGNDAIDSEGAVTVHATSSLTSSGGSVTPFGTSAATTTIGADTTATGIDGGAGDDAITNLDMIDVTASSSVTQNNSSFTFGGTGATGGSLAATTHAIGISGGDGSDDISSESAITVNASSTLTSSGGSTTPFGTSQAGATVGADTTATGIDGGAGDDSIMNLDSIGVTAGSTVTLGGTSFSLGGTGNAGGSLEASSQATGIDGGAGQDQIQNLGTIKVTATSDLDSQSDTNVGFGTSDTGGSAGATTGAVGIDGGSDDDFLNNVGTIDVTANSTVIMTGSTYTFGGTGSSAGTLAATTRATGMSGGDGADRLRNQGDVTVQAISSLDTKGESEATFGTSSGGATAGAVTEAAGLDGGAGDNTIENLLGTVDVSALTTVTANKSAYTFGGTASTGAALEGTARASGILAGDGANSVRNDADLSATATSHVTATGGTKTTFGGTSGSGTATADTDARGIDTGAGADLVMNSGTITVNAASDGTTSNSADAGWTTGSADTDSYAKGTAAGYGISAGDGDNALQNDGDINVTAKGTGYAFAYADGAHLSLWSGDGQAQTNSQAGASATGILAGNGRNQIVNNKAITVLAQATTVKSLTTTSKVCNDTTQVKQECTTTTDPDTGEVTTTCHDVVDSNGDPVYEVVSTCEDQEIVLGTKPTYSAAHGNGLSGDGNATSTGSSSAEAYGIKAGDGDNLIVNNGNLSVTASPEAKATVSVSAGTTGDATGSATASASARAYGIWAGNGNNEITNNGALIVTAAPKAQASADIAAGKGICIPFLFWTWCIADGTGTGTATATFDSLAVGIRTGDGNNFITNNGIMTVSAKPETDGAATSVTSGIDYPTLTTTVTSQAVGIQTGDGDNQIVNTANGVIDVEATAVPGSDCSPSCTTSTSAIGIQTGNGNNLIVNDGVITTSVPSGSGSRADVAIRTGGGNDIVQLGNGSSTIGSIELNAGDDSLTFIGSAKVAGLNDAPGSVDGGAGTDSLYFNGAGSFTGSIQRFENAAKDGAGAFVLSSLPTMQQLKISQGTLQTNSPYAFAPGGSYQAWIYGSGDHGTLRVTNGTAALAGSLSVNKGHGAYTNGTAYDVVEADQGLTGAFSDVALPVPSPLLHFSYEQLPNAAQVEANVASFATMATNPVGKAVATYLDTVLPTASGDLSDMLGKIQSLSAPDLSAAYASLSPDTYNSSTQAAAGGITANTGSLRQRMQNMRLGEISGDTRSASFPDNKPVMLAYDGTPGRLGRLLDDGDDSRHGTYGLWINAFGQQGDQDSDNTHAGFNYNVAGLTLGFDHDVRSDMLAGVSVGYARTNLNLDQNLGNGDINATVFSAYGSYFTDKSYVEGALSFGNNRFANSRNISISGANRIATSYHDGRLFAGLLAGGYYFKVSDWTWEPFASLQYSSLQEDSFDETGAGAVSLHMDEHRTQYLASDLGLRFRRALERANGILVPELSLAWNYNFNVDNSLITASFMGAPNTAFSVQGQNIERNGARLGGGLTYINSKRLASSLYYTAELRNGYVAQNLMGEIRYEFK